MIDARNIDGNRIIMQKSQFLAFCLIILLVISCSNNDTPSMKSGNLMDDGNSPPNPQQLTTQRKILSANVFANGDRLNYEDVYDSSGRLIKQNQFLNEVHTAVLN